MKMDLKTLSTVTSVLLAVCFWFYTINGLPPRIEKLEQKQVEPSRVIALEQGQIKLEAQIHEFTRKLEHVATTSELTLQTVNMIQSTLMRGKR